MSQESPLARLPDLHPLILANKKNEPKGSAESARAHPEPSLLSQEEWDEEEAIALLLLASSQ
jgi:hypothetical protein